jgi:hypothetical protein
MPMTLSGTTGTGLLSNNGYTWLPNNVLMQWGRGTAASAASGTSTSVTFPIAFPNGANMVTISLSNIPTGGSVAGTSSTVITALSTTGYTWQRGNNANGDPFRDFFWIAIGN